MTCIDTTTASGTVIGSTGVDAISAPAMRMDSLLVEIDDKYRLHPIREYYLFQNYPNPFSVTGGSAFGGNPTTSIAYDLPKPDNVRLAIYDLLGRHVKTLLDVQQPAGHFQTAWDGTDDTTYPWLLVCISAVCRQGVL